MPRDPKALSFNVWKCLACEGEPEFEHPEFMKHLQEVHKLETKGLKGKSSMIRHLDGREWFQTDDEVTIGDLKFIHFQRSKRRADDMMRF